ncbi:MAG: hypothetical protein ABI042_03665 [Verrucomicrobiota bacterium]
MRWIAYSLAGLFVLAITAILSIDAIAKLLAERRIESQTGFRASIGKLNLGIRNATVDFYDLVLKNPTQFHADTFLEMPELHIEYDRDALRTGKLHLKLVRFNLQKVHVVENAEGGKNIDGIQNQKNAVGLPRPRGKGTKIDSSAYVFDGIDRLEMSLGLIEFTSEKSPEKNFRQNFAVTNEVFHNLKTDLDFQTVGVVLILKAGLSGSLDFDTLLNAGSKAGKKSKTILQDVTEPLILETTNSLTK